MYLGKNITLLGNVSSLFLFIYLLQDFGSNVVLLSTLSYIRGIEQNFNYE